MKVIATLKDTTGHIALDCGMTTVPEIAAVHVTSERGNQSAF